MNLCVSFADSTDVIYENVCIILNRTFNFTDLMIYFPCHFHYVMVLLGALGFVLQNDHILTTHMIVFVRCSSNKTISLNLYLLEKD